MTFANVAHAGVRPHYAQTIRRLPSLLYVLIIFAWLGLIAYLWLGGDSWGYGWHIVGTINLTTAALLALGVVWLGSRVARRFANRSGKPS